MSGQFEIFADGASFRFRLTGEDSEVLAVSGAFPDKAAAVSAVMRVRENAAAGRIVDRSSVPAMPARNAHSRPNSQRAA